MGKNKPIFRNIIKFAFEVITSLRHLEENMLKRK